MLTATPKATPRARALVLAAVYSLSASGLAWTGISPAPAPARQPEAAPLSAAACLPGDLALVVTIRDGAGLVGDFRRLLSEYRFDETRAYAALTENPGFAQARVGVLGLAAAANTDAWTAGASIAGDELVFGLTPGKGPDARFIAVTVSADPAVRDRFLDQVRMATGLSRAGKPDPKRSRVLDGVTVYETENGVLHGQSGPALIASNSEVLFRAAIKNVRSPDHPPGPEAYRRAAERVPASARAWAFVDVPAIKAAVGADLHPLLDNPLGGLLFGGAWRSILDAQTAVAWLTFSGSAAKVDFDIAGPTPLPETHKGFLAGAADGPGFDPAALPGYAGQARVRRDWASLFAERESLLALPAAEQLVAFSSGLTTLMGQMDFVDDVLPRFDGSVYLVAARQPYPPEGYTPTPLLPAFAMVMPLKPGADSNGFGRRLYSASVMAISAANLIATQQGQPALIINPEAYRDCRVVTAVYDDPSAAAHGGAMRPAGAPPDGGGPARVNVRYNFAPAIGIVGDRYVIATSVGLLHSIIDGLLAGRPVTPGDEGDSLVIDGPALGAILSDNYEELAANRMLEKNRTRAEAERDVDAFLGLLRYARGLAASYHQSPTGFTGSIELRLAEPPAPAPGQ